MVEKVKQEIREVIENTPTGYYIDSIDTKKIGGEWVVHANYKQQYRTIILETQWPFGHTLPATIQLSQDINKLSNLKNGRFIRTEVTHFKNENFVNASGEDNEVASAVVKIYDCCPQELQPERNE